MCELPHTDARRVRLSYRSRRAIDDGGRSPTTALWAFPPSTWPRGSGWRGLFRLRAIAEKPGGGRRTLSNAKKRAGPRPARECRESGPPGLIAQARGVRHLFPAGQAFGDDLGRLQRRLAQGGILDDLA